MTYYVGIVDDNGKITEGYRTENPIKSLETLTFLQGHRACLFIEVPMSITVKAEIHPFANPGIKDMLKDSE